MSVTDFVTGQRWVSDTEPDLGLGLVIEAEHRIVKLIFPAADEERAYAIKGAPLSRLRLKVGDRARDAAGWELLVESVQEHNGLLTYSGSREGSGETTRLPETRLAHDLRISAPRDRLLTHQFDRNRWFELRHATLQQHAWREQNALRGLLGPRVAAIPHQLYIAHEIGRRYAPRVLLADEVGLGKTIEAGLILHQQWQTERAQRALIIVPPALTSQWILELLRRFNLQAAIFDAERCEQAAQASGDNPFATEQLVLCSLDFLVAHPAHVEQIKALQWDLLVVDEAHHLHWSPQAASAEYQLVESLAKLIPGVLLLTATPEQLGLAGHFARLRLLDPDRFSDFDSYIAEQRHFSQTAREVEALRQAGREAELQQALDRHGTGRVLFRNTRAHVGGFAQRRLHPHPLNAEESATAADPRVAWLGDWLRRERHKTLVICADRQTAMNLEQQLGPGIRSAAFHEGLGLVARDRAAAWFAQDDGAQALICSEIGSEGRNFQFVQHLVLFDLPRDPDLLEQRIGRLDRIGQRGDVHIHVPFLIGSEQQLLFDWFHQGLDGFEQLCRAGSQLQAEFATGLQAAIADPSSLPALLPLVQARRAELEAELENGRDRLLELSSCHDERAQWLRQQLLENDQDASLRRYLERVCDGFGIDIDQRDAQRMILRPDTDHEEGFRDISEDGSGFTTDRTTALGQEDLQFLSWEHPLITEAMDRILGSHRGNTALGILRGSTLPAGSLLLECLFQLSTVAPPALQLGRYLPPELRRVLIDNSLSSHSASVPAEALLDQVEDLPLARVKPVLAAQAALLQQMLARAQAEAEADHADLLAAAHQRIATSLTPELERLRYLRTINPNVRDSEIAHWQDQHDQVTAAVEKAQFELAAVRVVVVA